MTVALRIAGSGMCCAVGFSAPAARAAIRAGLDRFRESAFVDERGRALVTASLPLGDVWGPRRLAMMFEAAFRECVEGAESVEAGATAVLLLTAEAGRPGAYATWPRACFEACAAAAGGTFHAASRALPLGRAGIAAALLEARALLAERQVKRVVVGGVDSYLNAHAMNHFLRRGRVLSTDSSSGFIPGEGAGALLVELAPRTEAGLFVVGVGVAEETATVDNDLPVRAQGLTRAIRGALSESGYRMSELHFRVSDIAGEPFYFNESGLALTRAFDRRVPEFPLFHITDSVGETGAAIGPLSLAHLAGAMPRGHAPGTRALFHLAGDGGARAGVVVEYLPS